MLRSTIFQKYVLNDTIQIFRTDCPDLDLNISQISGNLIKNSTAHFPLVTQTHTVQHRTTAYACHPRGTCGHGLCPPSHKTVTVANFKNL